MNRSIVALCTAGILSLFISSTVFSQTIQISGGSGNVAIDHQNGPTSIVIPHISVEPSPATQSVANSLSKIVRFLEASNPTKIQLSNIRLLNWAVEDEKILTLDLENSSNMPGYKVKTILVAPLNGRETQSRTFFMKPARGFTKQTLDTLAVEAHGTQSVPIAAVSELKRFLSFPDGYDLIGVGLTANVPDALIGEYANQHRRVDGGATTDARTVGFIVQTTYQTAFDGKITASRGAFLYFAKPI